MTIFLADPICVPRRSASLHLNITRLALCLGFGLLGAGCSPHLTTKADTVAPGPNPMLNADYSEDAEIPFVMESNAAMAESSGPVNFESKRASRRTREMADWVVRSKDNRNMPFAIVDKINAKVYVFDANGQLQGAAPVLLGLGLGDDVAPGVSQMRMSLIPPSQRTTPAGRFQATMGRNSHGKDILWVDYENAISMHPVVTSRPEERRAQRLETPSPLDNRISYGCINVPVAFFRTVIQSLFSGTGGVVYVLPETNEGKPV
jgi:hypothetical protein